MPDDPPDKQMASLPSEMMTLANAHGLALEEVLWQHRCSDGVGGCTAISDSFLVSLAADVANLLAVKEAAQERRTAIQQVAHYNQCARVGDTNEKRNARYRRMTAADEALDEVLEDLDD